MQISDLLKQYMNAGSQSEPITKSKGVEKFSSSISGLEKGSVFEGTVNSVRGNQVVLGLGNGQLLTARMDMKLSLMPGQSMFFQVKSNTGNQVAITPFTISGNGANYTLLEALKVAGLPTDGSYITMVDKMMEEQMPIDKNSLNNMARVMLANPDIDVETLVLMKKLQIPISVEFASQFENYLNDKQSICDAMNGFTKELSALFLKDMPLEDMRLIGSNFLSVVTEGLEGNTDTGNEIILNENLNIIKNAGNNETVPDELQNEQLNAIGTENGIKENVANELQGEMNDKMSGVTYERDMKAAMPEFLGAILNDEEIEYLNGQLKVLFSEDENYSGFKAVDYNTNTVSLLKQINNFLKGNANIDKTALSSLLSGKEFNAMLKDALEQHWLIKPGELTDSEGIKKLYEHLYEKMDKMQNIVNSSGIEDTNVSNLIANVKDNIQFMNQINEAYAYVQIPLKMSGQSASGELYVYTNKKNAQDKDRELSAFLHLDLDNLGSTDVSIKMFRKNVTTNFYFDNDASYEIVKKNLPVLEERLQKKGYNCNINIVNEGHKVNFVNDFLKQEKPSSLKLHRYSFDMRA